MRFRESLAAVCVWLVFTGLAGADDANGTTRPALRSTAILTVTGDVGTANREAYSAVADPLLAAHGISFDTAVQFDFASLRAYAQEKVSAQIPGETQDSVLEGPRLQDVLTSVNAEGDTIVLHCLDGRKVELPMAGAFSAGAVLAIRANQVPFGIGDYGPISLLLPEQIAAGDWFVSGVFLIEVF